MPQSNSHRHPVNKWKERNMLKSIKKLTKRLADTISSLVDMLVKILLVITALLLLAAHLYHILTEALPITA